MGGPVYHNRDKLNRVELPELGHLSFRLVGQDPCWLVGGYWFHCNPGGAAVVVPLVTSLPELSITVEVIFQLNLLPHHVGHPILHQRVELCWVVGAGGEDLADVGGIRQPARVGGENPSFSALHVFAPLIF